MQPFIDIGIEILSLVKDLIGMLRSTRTWIFLITLAAVFLTLTQTGDYLNWWQAAIAAIAQVVLGGTSIVAKTVRSGSPGSKVPTTPTEVGNPNTPPVDTVSTTTETAKDTLVEDDDDDFDTAPPDTSQVFDVATFDKGVQVLAQRNTYAKTTEIAEFYAARAMGMERSQPSKAEVIGYWLYLKQKAIDAFQSVAGFDITNPPQELPPIEMNGRQCKLKDIKTWALYFGVYGMYRDVKWTVSKADTLFNYSEWNKNWYERLAPQSLYDAGYSLSA